MTAARSPISTILAPLAAYYDDPATVEIRMVRPGQVIVDRRNEGKKALDAPELTMAVIEDICRVLANVTGGEKFDPDMAPKLSCVVPEVRHRFECLMGASVQSGISLAIRCKHPYVPTWQQVGANEALVSYLRQVVLDAKNIVVSGATNTGKTTFINKLLTFLPDYRRLIVVEDTPELEIDRFWDSVGLVAAREASPDSGMLGYRPLYDHICRATPDGVIFGEISTQNAFAALAALNAGISGFICSIHASSPEQALNRKFDQNIAWSGGGTMPNVPEYLHELVDVVVQIKRDDTGMRRITDVYEASKDRWVMKDGKMIEPALRVVASQPEGEAS